MRWFSRETDHARVAAIFVPALWLLASWPCFAQTLQPMAIPVAAPQIASQPPAQSTDFHVLPSIETFARCRLTQQEQTLQLIFICIDPANPTVYQPNCTINLDPEAQAGSGGHNHTNSGRPNGTFNPSSGNTGSDGLQFLTTYTAPEISGIININESGVDQFGNALIPNTQTMGVEIDGFSALPTSGPSGQWAVIQSTYHDFNNAYALPAVVSNLEAVPVSFANYLSKAGVAQPPIINYTSLNLIYGGLFDIDATWTPPHCGHRLGNETDLGLSNIPLQDRNALKSAVEDNNFYFPYRSESPSN